MMGIRKKFKELKNQKLTLFRPDDIQWLTLGQLQQRYDDLKDQRDKQMACTAPARVVRSVQLHLLHVAARLEEA